jgi:catechol 2,3-dioxygenase-like lactoylglutathione lyase family enzyme
MNRLFDHVDLRVDDLERCGPFYRWLLPHFGFTTRVDIEGWIQFEAPGTAAAEFFGVTEDRRHVANANRVAFWADSKERVDALAAGLQAHGARAIEGPAAESPTYYAVYFEDPCGNRFELVYRSERFEQG